MKAASFFTGIAGFDLGFEQAGIEIVFQCEKDKNCCKLLDSKYPTITKSLDINTLDPLSIPYADIYFGGFPCQDASLASNRLGIKREGLDGKRTGLFFEFVRILKANQPQWIVLENVFGLLSSNKREDFKRVIESLEECGYYISWRVLDSQYFGIPQHRRRLFIVGCLRNWQNPIKVLFEDRIENQNIVKSKKTFTRSPNKFTKGSKNQIISVYTNWLTGNSKSLFYEDLTPTLCASSLTFSFLVGSQLRYPTPEEIERLQGFPTGWTEGFSDACRYRMIGNTVSVPVAKFIGDRIINTNNSKDFGHSAKCSTSPQS